MVNTIFDVGVIDTPTQVNKNVDNRQKKTIEKETIYRLSNGIFLVLKNQPFEEFFNLSRDNKNINNQISLF